MAKKQIIELKGTNFTVDAEYIPGKCISFYMDTAKITVYKPGQLDDKRADPDQFNITIGRKASEPISLLYHDEIGEFDVLVEAAVFILDKEDM